MSDNRTRPADERRPWSPYRRDEDLVLDLPVESEEWDPVERDRYLIELEETPPAEMLILETRRHAITSDPLKVDLRPDESA